MGTINSDNEFDIELQKYSTLLEALKKEQSVFAIAFRTMPIKERAKALLKIHALQKDLSRFVEKSRSESPTNAGSKFKLENLKQGFNSLKTQWRKIEASLDGASIQSSSTEATNFQPNADPLSSSVKDYAALLKKSGVSVSDSQLDAFKSNLSQSLKIAEERTGKKNFDVRLVAEDGKIKVKINPKD